MKQFLLLLTILFLVGCGRSPEQYLKQADQAFESGDRDAAKKLYLKAAEKGNPEAHFALAYKYVMTPQESIYHFSEAAQKGHEQALDYALDALFFRANSLERANPQAALDVYKEAKKTNPTIQLYDEENKIKTLQMSAEAGEFDAEAFCKKYDVLPHDESVMYHVWTIAEEVSKGGRFGKPDPKLIFHLVSRGGWAPAEIEVAVAEAYKNWKSGAVKEFNICDHITSGGGATFCASRSADKNETDRNANLKTISQKLNDQARKLLDDDYALAVRFIDAKALTEEGHGGSGRGAWIIGSQIKQKNGYLELVEKARTGFKPSPQEVFLKADAKLNETYKRVMGDLERQGDGYDLPSPEEVRAVQRFWIPYRDATAHLFAIISPATTEDIWKSWLTEIREKQLLDILPSSD